MNRNVGGETGLELKCNDFTTCEYDIAVTTDTLTSNLGIRYYQGSNEEDVTAPANNIFSYTHNNDESDFFNGCEDITYWYAYYNNGYNLEPVNFTPIPSVNPETEESYNFIFKDSTGCPTSFPPGGGPWWTIDTNTQILSIAESKIDSIQNLLDLLVDGGDTKELNQEVETSFPDDAVELHGELMANSPYLSDSVMVSSVEQENVLTDAMVTDILIANPQSAKSDTVQQALDDRSSQLSEEQREDIDQGWFETGAKESLESLLSYYKGMYRKALNNIIRVYLTDSVCPKPSDSLIVLLESQNSVDMQYQLAFVYASIFDFNLVDSVLSSIPQSFDLSVGQLAQYQQYVSYFGLLEQCYNEGITILEADSSQVESLYNIYNNSSGSLHAMMRNILINIDSLQYSESYILPEESLKEGKIRRKPVRKEYQQNSFKLYPNPAGEYVIFEYTIAGSAPDGYVLMYDNKGTIVKTLHLGNSHDYNVIQVNDLSSGIYYCKFVVNGKMVQSEKLIILN